MAILEIWPLSSCYFIAYLAVCCTLPPAVHVVPVALFAGLSAALAWLLNAAGRLGTRLLSTRTHPVCPAHAAGGSIPSPFDCYMANRGLKTLHIRMKEHQKNAMAVSRFLQSSPHVTEVIYPGGCICINSLLPNDAIWCHDLCALSISLWEFIWGI